jgi:hypothetical protein
MRFRKNRCCVVWNCNAKSFIQDKKLKIVWEQANATYGSFSIIGQNDNLTSAFQEIEAELKIVLE